MTSSPPSLTRPAASRIAGTSVPAARSNTASTVATSASVRMTSVWARAPRISSRASTRIDLPAPVSPVSTFRPASNGVVTDSMTATLRMRSSRSIGVMLEHSAGRSQSVSDVRHVSPARDPEQNARPSMVRAARSALTPLELGSQDREEILESDEPDGGPSAAYRHHVVLAQAEADLAIDRQHHLL